MIVPSNNNTPNFTQPYNPAIGGSYNTNTNNSVIPRGGVASPGSIFNSPSKSTLPTSQYGNPATFTAAANTQASDYDNIMKQYSDLASNFSNNPITAAPVNTANVKGPSPITPQLSKYEQSADVTESLANLSDLSTTGGYSPADIQNIRERDISPIRSIYANAQQNAERQRALSGGYSPNFNAVQAQMARDESNKIGDITTSANAGIAQNVASNRISAASPYAGASATANAAKTAADQHNTDIINQINEFNASTAASTAEANANRAISTGEFNTQAALDAAKTSRSGALSAIGGEASLYGTTPALTNTFGNQVAQATQLGQNQQQINNQRQGNILNAGMSGNSSWRF